MQEKNACEANFFSLEPGTLLTIPRRQSSEAITGPGQDDAG
jgi:hypothetical protein